VKNSRFRGKPVSTDTAEADEPSAVITFQRVTGMRDTVSVFGRDSRELDSEIIESLNEIRLRGHLIIKTEMTVHGEDWVYEYDEDGHVTRAFRNGDLTP
jgi:YD repeat-containing protein